jgi:hypothetical protein
MFSAAWNNPAGGLRYHLRALRSREHAWRPFREGLELFFADWRPPAKTLAIVGPSGGYCVPLGALAQFERFVVFEPDPVARMIFKRRLRAALPDRSLTFIAEDAWISPLLRGGGLPSALFAGSSALLFSNFIGQLAYIVRDREFARFSAAWRAQLWPVLERTPWASFHDRVSGAAPPPRALPAGPKRLSDVDLRALYEPGALAAPIELVDHGSSELLPPARRYGYLNWPLTPDGHHLIECAIGGPA